MPAGGYRFYRRRFFNLVGFGPRGLEIFLHLCLQVFALCAEDGLNAGAYYHHACSAEGFEFFRTGLGNVVQLHAQARNTCIEAGDVAASAKGAYELQLKTVALALRATVSVSASASTTDYKQYGGMQH